MIRTIVSSIRSGDAGPSTVNSSPMTWTAPGDRSNLHRINLGYQVEPATGMSLRTNYNALFAYANRLAGTPGFSDHGSFKGHLLTALL